jgi:hypothetical protein
MTRTLAAAALFAAIALVPPPIVALMQTDLDAFMQQVLARRDDNWKKLQQYILDEHERIEFRGPAGTRLWGDRRDYTWYIRDGFFVRSPVSANGVAIPEDERRKYETDYLARVKRRDARAARQAATDRSQAQEPAPQPEEPPADVAGLILQSREPQFISSAYFLRFRFDEGTYALVGREKLEGREVLRIEYYPTRLFENRQRNREPDNDDRVEAEMRRLMNKVALVTLWIEPASRQILKTTYDNVSFDFLPGQWLVRVEDVRATMTMGQPFPDVWLPRGIEADVSLTLALGPIDVKYSLEYDQYRQAEATVNIR